MSNGKGRWLGALLATVAIVAPLLYGGFRLVQQQSDGPLTDMIPGGPLRSGPLVAEKDVDWAAVLDESGDCADGDCTPLGPVELQLVEPPRSRYTGIMLHDGELYVPCDLGYMWGRFTGTRRWMLNLIYVFKRWHEDALADGRAVLRIAGRRYLRQAVRVTDPELVRALKSQLEAAARRWVAPAPLADAPTQAPNDIWFFRMDPR